MATVFIGGCGTTVIYSPLRSSRRSTGAPPSSLVQVLTREPSRGFVTIGLLECRVGLGFGAPPDALAQLRDEAARHGCDAILVRPTRAGMSAGCIVYTDSARDDGDEASAPSVGGQ